MKDRKLKKKSAPSYNTDRHESHNFRSHNEATRPKPYQDQGLSLQGIPQHGMGDQMVQDMPTRSQMICDPANICTLVGVMLSSFAMAAMWKGSYDLGMALNLVANVADIIDGPIARNTPHRPLKFSILGAKLDTYSDLISHFVVPASLVMNISSLDFMYVGLATLWVITGIIRQSYFEVMMRCDNGACVFGVASDYMPPLLGLTLHLIPIFGAESIRHLVLPDPAACTLFMINGSFTSSLKTRHYSGFVLVISTVYNLSLALSLMLMTLKGSFHLDGWQTFQSWEGLSLALHLLLAYPCYFRFVELNL